MALCLVPTLFIEPQVLQAKEAANKHFQPVTVRGRVLKIFPKRQVGQRQLRYVLLGEAENFHHSEAMLRICLQGCDGGENIPFEELNLQAGQVILASGHYKKMKNRGRVIQSRVILVEAILMEEPTPSPPSHGQGRSKISSITSGGRAISIGQHILLILCLLAILNSGCTL